jgi:hypothetical protein
MYKIQIFTAGHWKTMKSAETEEAAAYWVKKLGDANLVARYIKE